MTEAYDPESRLNAIVNMALDAIITIDNKGLIKTFNPSAEKMFGYTASSIIGKNVSTLMPAPYTDQHDAFIEQHEATGMRKIPQSGRELLGRRKDGSIFPINLSINPIQYGEESGYAGIIRDISKQKKDESTSNLFGEVLNQSINEIYMFDAETLKFIRVNRGAADNLGYSFEELKNITPVDIKPELTLEEFRSLTLPLVNGNTTSIRFQTVHQRKDETTYPAEINLQYTKANGQALFFAIVLDITERIQANNVINETKQQLEHLLLASPVITYSAKAYGDYSANYISPNINRVLGYDAEVFIDDPEFWSRCVHPDDRAQVLKELSHLYKNDKHSQQYRFLLPDGRYEWLQGDMRLERDAQGRPNEIVGTWQNIESRKQSEHDLLSAKIKAEKASEAKSVFLSRMSHELRTPLNAIMGFSQVIKKKGIENKDYAEKSIDSIMSASWHLLNLVNDVLDISNIENGTSRTKLLDCSLNKLILDSTSYFSNNDLYPNSKIEVLNTDFTIKADPFRAKQVFINLISNALKYNKDGGRLTIDATEIETGEIEITFTDTGIGISEEDLGSIFEAFTRLSHAQNHSIEGAGIGLTLAKQLVKDMNGSLRVESTEGVGSVFTVKLNKGSSE